MALLWRKDGILAVHLNKVGLWVVMNGGKIRGAPINGLLNEWGSLGGCNQPDDIPPLIEVLGFSTPFTTSRADLHFEGLWTFGDANVPTNQEAHHRLQRREIQGFFRRIFGSPEFSFLFCGFKRWKRSEWLFLFPELFRKIFFLFGIFHLYIIYIHQIACERYKSFCPLLI